MLFVSSLCREKTTKIPPQAIYLPGFKGLVITRLTYYVLFVNRGVPIRLRSESEGSTNPSAAITP